MGDLEPNTKGHTFEAIQVAAPDVLPGAEVRSGYRVKPPVPRHWHQEYQFCLIIGGAGTVSFKGTTIPTPKHSLFMISPGDVHANECTDAQGCSYRTIFLSADVVSSLGDDSPSQGLTANVTREPKVLSRFQNAFHALQLGESRLVVDSALSEFFVASRDTVEKTEQEGPSFADHPGLERARNYLHEFISENVSLEALASQAGMSRYHFGRSFNARYGVPPHLFQIQLRVLRAKKLLLEGHSIGEAALAVGFADQSHLNRHFKRLTAVTPGQYARLSKIVQDA